jgi:hypothetical protein
MSNEILGPNRRDFLKGVVFGAGGYALGSLLIHPEEAMGQSIENYLEKVPMEARWNIASSGLIFWSVTYLKEIYDTKGREQYLEHWKKTSPIVAARGKGFADRLGFTGSDAKSAAAIISATLTLSYGPQHKLEIEGTTEKAKVKCANCVFWNAVQARKITDDICTVHSQYWWDGFANSINPKLSSTLIKARPRGDSVCEWVIELKT